MKVVFNYDEAGPVAWAGALATAVALAASSGGGVARADGTGRPPVDLTVHGWGDLQFAFHDYGPDQNRDGGSQRDARLTFDTTRFVIELEGTLPHDIELEAEVELEHGGAGTALELEYEEFGEFETEVERGGEVVLEELWVARTFAGRYRLALGRFYVGVGVLSRFYRPTDYLGTARSEAETTVIPQVWDEMGAAFTATFGRSRVLVQLINGLDSTGFSSQRWVASGHQTRFEVVRATDLAVVVRYDFTPATRTEVGASFYAGGTSRNRPKPDLVPNCMGGEPGDVAPCGYVSAPVLLADVHATAAWGPVRGSAMALWGHLGNADAVSSRNERLSNELGVLRTPVADEALAVWLEAGVDVAPWLRLGEVHRLEPFARFDYYDTMFATREGLFDNPRFERTVVTAGVSYTLDAAFFAKLDASHRRLGSSAFNTENTVRLSTGFVY